MLLGAATGTATSIMTVREGNNHPTRAPGVIGAGFGQHVLLLKEAVNQGIVTAIDKDHARLQRGKMVVLPLQQLREGQDSFSIDLSAKAAYETLPAAQTQHNTANPSVKVIY